MKLKLFLFIFLSLLFAQVLPAQKNTKITITGNVIDAEKKPIPNAIIMIDGEKTSSVTDSKGTYKIKVKQTAARIGVFTFGNGIKEEDISGRTEIDFNFGSPSAEQPVQEIAPGDKPTDVGYAVVKNKNTTTPVTTIDGSNKKYASYSSAYEMIQREVTGVKISGTEIVIQDSKNLWGPIPALLIVDGVYVDSFADIQPSSVKSIEVLKGSAAGMYGSRGYGGVIILKTKMGNE
jgi:hypothetical protein